jgi:hypothetical protein
MAIVELAPVPSVCKMAAVEVIHDGVKKKNVPDNIRLRPKHAGDEKIK